ncbi:AbrB/MazE/SpoVT family DNA-binding domain-containing protein [Peribacillus frigoritolerans]|uniref:AbrB/MazE/SpoVT family DNA-binding domain-containing protein n=1 Tax=Peribacillus frigoritolerans TaxID=450367 RepID=UPI0025708653|nr:AbrB/MazE/SpoVT family DNA-binding domain-containing protein [Peribacillus frigoritolerans]WJE49891.1 AbrB/MazE/SpoVT family DNA-binding domain-containing protein [Peribacillus frigoritolerans]
MERKIVKVGNSLGVIIPAIYLEELGVTHKDTVEMEFYQELQTLVIKKEKTTPNNNYLEQVIKRVVDGYLKEKGL